jgi:tetratricopeptide (TPR) repeat protein
MSLRRVVTGTLALALLPALAAAQNTANIVGILLGPDGSPLVGADVVMEYHGHLAKTYRMKTDKSGRFLFVNAFTGPHDITFTKEGLGDIQVKDYTFHELGQFEKPPVFRFAQRKVEVPAPASGVAPAAGAAASATAGELTQVNALLAAGRVDEALAGYEALAAKDPGSASVHRMLGAAAKKKGDAARAEAEMRKAVELAPEDPLAHRDLGVLLYETGRAELALPEAEKAVALDPQNGALLFNLGLIYQNAGRSQDAWDALVKAEAADPQNAEVQYYLGTVAVGLGKTDEAVARFKKYLSTSPANAQNVATANGLVAALSKKP